LIKHTHSKAAIREIMSVKSDGDGAESLDQIVATLFFRFPELVVLTADGMKGGRTLLAGHFFTAGEIPKILAVFRKLANSKNKSVVEAAKRCAAAYQCS
ncbi:MAG: hypothetical protein ABJA67_15195, partial [Chthonomonadales bacterium]